MLILRLNKENAASMELIPLADLRPGRRGVLVSPNGGPPVHTRLRELGFVAGTTVIMVRRMPLGGAVEVAIRGCRICLRRRDLQGLTVTLDGDTP